MIEWTMGEDEEIKPEHRRDYIGGIFQETTYGEDDNESGVADMLADLMHFCDLENIDFDDKLRIAKLHFKEEKDGAARVRAEKKEAGDGHKVVEGGG